ncbi:MAG: hypothetical protein LRS48_03305 [Desulfurococcales archaeon]|nr:hypothetical protein [Desulfurococcales archaeon]
MRQAARKPIVVLVALAVIVAVGLAVTLGTRSPRGGTAGPGTAVIPGAPKCLDAVLRNAPVTVNVSSPQVRDGRLAVECTCDGTGRPPTVYAANLSGSKCAAIVIYDPDAPRGPFIHLVLVEHLAGSRVLPPVDGAVVGVNSAGRAGYYPACPPRGSGIHRYVIVVIGLDYCPGLHPGFSLESLCNSIKGHVVGYGYTAGAYARK